MAIDLAHVLQIDQLPDHHKDPFDRILIAQAQVGNMPILTIDRLIAQYPVSTIW
ncbi:type II toxin-antitoxin system VapC family toxin [Alkalinema pantanalense CENA528]|uniref:type II toxin-antitoxin system VapC family toxin n=1 Tax=Alkalinema pantanalense TaxID=1620705 RepID=UPI003D6FA490